MPLLHDCLAWNELALWINHFTFAGQRIHSSPNVTADSSSLNS